MVKAEVLGQLLLMQNVLINLPDKKSILSFACRGLSDIPGVENVLFSEEENNIDEKSTLTFRLEKYGNLYGFLIIKLADYTLFSVYEQYIRNFVFMVEVILEENNQRQIIQKHQVEMEQRIEERTRQLMDEIEERKQIEESLKESNNLLRIAGEKAKLGWWTANIDEQQVYWSDVVAAIHELYPGYSPKVDEGIDFYALEWREKILKVYNDCARSGIPFDEEMEIVTAIGNRKWVRIIGEAIKNENGKIYKIQGAFQDISERKQKELEIRQQLDELKRWHNVTLGRETRIMEIKREVNELCKRLGEPPRYPSQENEI